MTESKFNELIDQIFFSLEMALDEIDADMDYETSGGVLTVIFENETRLVFSRQPPTRQLWLAARSGGFHFAFDEEAGDWRDPRIGRGTYPTFPADLRAIGWPLDQLMLKGDLDLQSFAVLPDNGSDHRAMIARLCGSP